MQFSNRLRWDSPPNALTRILDEKRVRGVRVVDLTASNPTRASLPYPLGLLEPLADPRALVYEPRALGHPEARAEIARTMGLPAEDVVVCASTSEAYSYLFKLLCDPGDAVAVPEPSYPLFDYLAGLEGVRLLPYRLAWDGAWHIDFQTIDVSARAILVVSPNNPTGSYLKRDEWERLQDLGIPVISDEVFAGYPADDISAPDRVVCAAAGARTLTFSLGGLSKSAGLPQLKLGWIGVAGAEKISALEKLETIADSYLSASTPVQLAAGRLIEAGAEIRRAILARVRRNRAALAKVARGAISLLPAEGGWSAILRAPATRTDEDLALELLRDHDVLVHPGYFFDLPQGTYLVVSLLPPEAEFDRGVAALDAVLSGA